MSSICAILELGFGVPGTLSASSRTSAHFRARFRVPRLPARSLRQFQLSGRRRRAASVAGAFFALFKVTEVVAHGNADAFQRLLADARNLFELLRRHVGQSLHRGDAGGHQLLNDAVAQLGNLLDRR